MTHGFFALTAQLVLGAVWAVAGVAKLAQGRARADAVTEFGLLPLKAAALFGIVLPYAELALSGAFLTGACVGLASATSVVLLALFSAAMGANLARGRQVRCNCFGQMGRSEVSWFSVARNLVLVALALTAASATDGSWLAIESWGGRHARLVTAPPEFLPSALCAAAMLLGWQLIVSAWTVAAAVAAADGGPVLGLPERRYLRRWLRIETQPAGKE